jgi:hypothetical protein
VLRNSKGDNEMKDHLPLLPLLLTLFIISSCLSSIDKSNPIIPASNLPISINTFENANLYLSSGNGDKHFKIIVLNGDWHEMGRQYGQLLGGLIREFYAVVVKDSGMSYSYLKTKGEECYDNYPKNIKDLISGMAETSGLSLEQQKILYFTTRLIFLASNMGGCSQLSAWGAYTGGQPLVIGRNADLPSPFINYQKYLCVVVYNPKGSTNSAAEVTFVATTPMPPTFLNSSGIYVAVNSAQYSDPTYNDERTTQISSTISSAVFNCSTITDVNASLMNSTSLPCSIIINVADTNEGRVYELSHDDGAKVRNGNGFVASTNHFIIPEWTGLQKVLLGVHGGYSIERFNNLYTLVEQYKGSIDAQLMMKIFEKNLFDGGPTFDTYTIFQVVTVPSAKIMWVKAPEYREWEKIDLNLFFKF